MCILVNPCWTDHVYIAVIHHTVDVAMCTVASLSGEAVLTWGSVNIPFFHRNIQHMSP